MSIRFASVAGLSSLLLLGSNAHALGLAENASDTTGWGSSYQASSHQTVVNSGKLYRYGEQWWERKWGARGAIYQSDHNGLDFDTNKHLAVDVKRRLFSSPGNSYLAVGLGWDDIELSDAESTSGMRFVAEGRYDLFGPAYLFGQAAATPWLSDIEGVVDPFGTELEIGLAINPYPSMSLKAGYRNYWLGSANTENEILYDTGARGVFLGGGINW